MSMKQGASITGSSTTAPRITGSSTTATSVVPPPDTRYGHTFCSSSLARALSHRSGCAVGRVRPRALWKTQQFRARIGVLSKDFGRRGTGVYGTSSSRCGTCVVFSVLHVFSPRWRFLQPPCPSFACDPDPSYAAGAKPSKSLVRCPTGVPLHLPRIRLSRGNRCW